MSKIAVLMSKENEFLTRVFSTTRWKAEMAANLTLKQSSPDPTL